MTRYADPHRCPDCRAALPGVPARTACPDCGLPLEGPTAVELFATLLRADSLIATLRASAPAGLEPAPAYPSYPSHPATATTSPAGPPAIRWTVPGVLLALGALCLVIGGLVFLAVTWTVLGVGGRTTVLVALTGAAALGTYLSARRGLRGAAETFAAVSGLFLALDLAGAAGAGWFGDASGESVLLVAALVVVLATAAGNAGLRRLATGPLVAPQLVSCAAALVAGVAGVLRFDSHVTTATAVAVLAAAVLGEAARFTGQPILTWGARGLAVVLWSGLVVAGLARAADAWGLGGRGAASWTDVQALVVAAGLAAGFALLAQLRDLGAAPIRQAAAVAASWLVPVAVAAVLGGTVTALVLVAVGATAVVVVLALVLRPLTSALAIAALGLAAAATVGALGAVGLLAGAVAAEVSEQVDLSLGSGSPDLLAVADLDPVRADVAAPWTVPLVVLAVAAAAALLVRARLGRPTSRWAWATVAVAAPVAAVTGLSYAPALLAVVGAAGLLAAFHVVAAVRRAEPWAAGVDAGLASGWAVVAGVVAVYHPAPAVAVSALAAAVVTTYAVRSGSEPCLVATPLLGAASTGAVCWLADVPTSWSIAVVIVAVAVLTTVVGAVRRSREPQAEAARTGMYVVALVAALVLVLARVASLTEASPSWLVAYLSLVGAGAAAVAISERSQQAAWVAAGLELGATWVRLGDAGVDTPEAYTLPLAAVLLAFGGWTLWRDPRVGTTRTLGPGVVAALVPSLLMVARDPVSLRALVVAGACAVLIVVGARWRLRAPLLSGAVAGAVLAIVELAPYHDAVPRWALLTVAGACLVLAGVRWEYLAGVGRRGWGRVAELR